MIEDFYLTKLLAKKIPYGAVLIFDREYRFMLAEGEDLLKKHGYTNVVGKTVKEVLSSEGFEQLFPVYQKTLQGEPTKMEYEGGGGSFWVKFEPLKDKDIIVGGMVIIVEISKLQNEKKEMSQSLHMISHDTKSPLSSILALAKLYMAEEDECFQQEYVKKIRETAEGGLDYIHNVLSSKVALIDFDKMASALKEVLDIHPNAPKIKFLYRNRHSGSFHAKKSLIKSLIENLVLNAYKYHDLSKEKCFVKLTVEGKGKKLKLKVEDNGKGIEKSKQQEIFNLGSRASHKEKGYGVGLFIISNILKKLNGKLSMESTLGEGTVFAITIGHNEPHQK